MLPSSLRARLLLAFLVVAAAALGTVGVAVLLVGPGYFAEAMGHPPNDPTGAAMDEATRAAFADAMRRALLAASVIAIAAATVVSLAVAARIARPIGGMAAAARRIAGGHYAERVPVAEPDELGELADSFNAMADSLESTERRRLQLVGDVAHELRTPLTTLDGYLEGLEDGVIAPNEETWRLLRSEAGRLTGLVNDLADLWRAEAHQLVLEAGPVDLGAVAAEAVERFAPLAGQRQVALTAGGAGTATADRNRVIQIVGNFLSNAIRHAPEGSTVRVEAAVGDGRARLAVSDTGPGLTPSQRDAVFQRFYRVDAARSRAEGGSGIGLAIAGALATAMGGRAWAESPGLGRGSTFIVELPAPVTES
ncbi:MAG TPA: HAMP domain-containing sensor histidine kinase [Candidatus Limnocylindrales bacterium]|nr:HAMP domain-containing sensor histidine kinase [Candidatus Limnocylindrales bacterium]